MFDLKAFRETKLTTKRKEDGSQTHMTQEDIGKLLGIPQDHVSRLERNPDQITLEMLLNLCRAFGMTPDQVLSFKLPAPEALQVEDTFQDLRVRRNVLNAYIDTQRRQIQANPALKQCQEFLTQLDGIVRTFTSKPVVAVLGLSDAGKSRLINSITGMDKLVASWTPTTSITVYLKHIKEKPEWMKEEAWVFRAGQGDATWNFRRYNDLEYCESWKLTGGGVEVLKEYGTRQGGRGAEAGSAVLYLDSPLLLNCDLVDLPGFGTGSDEDEKQAAQASRHCDVILYLSPANGFLRGIDLQFLKSAIMQLAAVNPALVREKTGTALSPLSNLFIVASQAHTVDGGDVEKLHEILDKGCERLYPQIPDEVWLNKSGEVGLPFAEFGPEALRARFFTYAVERPDLRRDLEGALVETLSNLPLLLEARAEQAIRQFKSTVKESLAAELHRVLGILEERKRAQADLAEQERRLPEHKARVAAARQRVEEKVRQLNSRTQQEFRDWFATTITPERIKQIIQDRNYSKKEAQEYLPGNVNDLIYGKVQTILKDGSEQLNDVITAYLETYKTSTESLSKISFQGVEIPFDFKGAFTAGLAGATVLGGLGLWAATLGNLGGYILVAKGVSLLSALGISISGGTAAAAAAVSLIGGPITIAIGLALSLAALLKWVLGESWESRLAKKMHEQLRENDIVGKYNRDVIQKFWRDTEVGFDQVASAMDRKVETYMADMRRMITTESDSTLREYAEKVEAARDFFAGVPWGPSF